MKKNHGEYRRWLRHFFHFYRWNLELLGGFLFEMCLKPFADFKENVPHVLWRETKISSLAFGGVVEHPATFCLSDITSEIFSGILEGDFVCVRVYLVKCLLGEVAFVNKVD